MSSHATTRKRKSVDGTVEVAKRAKVVKSADKPAPLKSALKKSELVSKSTKPLAEKKQSSKSTKTKPKPKKDNAAEKDTEVTDEGEDIGGTDLTPDQTAALLAGFSSSDEEDDDEAGIAISSIPKAPTTGLIQNRINQAISEQEDPETTPGVIYIGRIPHGFYEPQMRAYFSQFGEILKLRLGRNRKTGKSQHHAFVQFASAAVADIVVKTMDKYLLFGHLLQVRRVPKEQVKENMFKGAGRRKKPAPRNRLEGGKLKRGATRDVWESRVELENKRRAEKAQKLKEMGYEFDMPVLRAVADVPVKHKADAVDLAVVQVNGDQSPLGIDGPVSESVIEKVAEVRNDSGGDIVKEKTVPKKRSASGKTETKKVVKKAKA